MSSPVRGSEGDEDKEDLPPAVREKGVTMMSDWKLAAEDSRTLPSSQPCLGGI